MALKTFVVKGSFAGRNFMLKITAENEADCRAMYQSMLKVDSVEEEKKPLIILGANTDDIKKALKKIIN